MHNIIRYISQNKIKIVGIIFFILFGYSIIRTANDAYEKQGQNEQSKYQNEVVIQTDGTVKLTNRNCENVIKEFLNNCTSGNYEKAYTYLSEECKENSYPTLEDFTNNYCVKKAIKDKGYSIKKQNNSKYKYKIEFNNMLSTGKIDLSTDVEYYEITVDNGHDIKLNID